MRRGNRGQRANQPGMHGRDRPADQPAPGMPDQVRVALAKRLDQPGDVTGQRPAVIPARRLVRVAVPAQIDRDRAKTRRAQRAQLRPPRPPELGKPCNSNTSGPLPCSATCNRMPLADTSRCVHGPGMRTVDGSGACDTAMLLGIAGPQRVDRVATAMPQRGGGVLDRLDGLLWRPDPLEPLEADPGQRGRAEQHQHEDHQEAEPQLGPRPERLVDAQRRSGQRERQRQQHQRQRDQEHHTAGEALLDLAGDLDSGQLDLGAQQGRQMRGRVLHQRTDRLLTRVGARSILGQRNGRDGGQPATVGCCRREVGSWSPGHRATTHPARLCGHVDTRGMTYKKRTGRPRSTRATGPVTFEVRFSLPARPGPA